MQNCSIWLININPNAIDYQYCYLTKLYNTVILDVNTVMMLVD